MRLGPFLPVLAVFGLLWACGGHKSSPVAPSLSLGPGGGWMCALRVTGDGPARVYGLLTVDPQTYHPDSAYWEGPVSDPLAYSSNYSESWQPACSGWVGFTYHAPKYQGARFWIATGKDSLWGSLACADIGLYPDTTCRDTVYFPTDPIYWGSSVPIVLAEGDHNFQLRRRGWTVTFHSVERIADSLIVCPIDVHGPGKLRIEFGRMARSYY